MDANTIWMIITGIFVPVVVGGFWLLWNKTDGIKTDIAGMISGAMKRVDDDSKNQWSKINETASELKDFKLLAEQRFAKSDDVRSLISEVKSELKSIDDKLDRLAMGHGRAAE